jgi:toxin ParE1/3/4
MKLRFTLRAAQDLIEIAEYLRERNPAGATRVRDAILRSLQTLSLFPEIGRKQSVEGVRKLATRGFPYLIYYNLNREADEIVVLTIRHAARTRRYTDV